MPSYSFLMSRNRSPRAFPLHPLGIVVVLSFPHSGPKSSWSRTLMNALPHLSSAGPSNQPICPTPGFACFSIAGYHSNEHCQRDLLKQISTRVRAIVDLLADVWRRPRERDRGKDIPEREPVSCHCLNPGLNNFRLLYMSSATG